MKATVQYRLPLGFENRGGGKKQQKRGDGGELGGNRM